MATRSFKSPAGRVFILIRVGSAELEIRYRSQKAGAVYCDDHYAGKPYHASTRALYWRFAGDAPVGIGFDVAAFKTLDECLTAWGCSADEILDWRAGLPVRTIYGTRQKVV